MSGPLRVGIVGARRARQGLGPFVARDLAAHGAQVVQVLGRTPESAAAAADEVGRRTGAAPAALHDPERFDAEGDLHAVCVLTPKGRHLDAVERALHRGRHVLVEKPFLWHGPDDGVPAAGAWGPRVDELAARFAARGLVLEVNAQWPATLDAFRALHGELPETAARLAMGLAPASRGRDMLGDALPHPLSLAVALRPDLEGLEGARFVAVGPDALRVEARLVGRLGPLDLEVELDGDVAGQPRPAWYAIDGVRADRCVRTADYALFLRDGARLVDMEDPLRRHLGGFLAQVAAAEGAGRPARTPRRDLGLRARLLEELDRAWAAAGGPL